MPLDQVEDTADALSLLTSCDLVQAAIPSPEELWNPVFDFISSKACMRPDYIPQGRDLSPIHVRRRRSVVDGRLLSALAALGL